MIGVVATLAMLVVMVAFVVRFEVRSLMRRREFDRIVASMDIGNPARVTEIRRRIRSTPPGAMPTQELATIDTERAR
jgi:hypothetical protein